MKMRVFDTSFRYMIVFSDLPEKGGDTFMGISITYEGAAEIISAAKADSYMYKEIQLYQLPPDAYIAAHQIIDDVREIVRQFDAVPARYVCGRMEYLHA